MHKNLKTLTIVASAMLTGTHIFADTKPVILDLTKAEVPLTFDANNGSWTGTFDDTEFTIDSQCYSFIKDLPYEYVWSGFTASNSTDNTFYTDANTAHQWSSMAKGGIALDSEGNVKTEASGKPCVDANMPYMVGFYNTFPEQPCYVVINDGKEYDAMGCYVSLNSYTYYILEKGDNFCRAFNRENDRLVLSAHGVHADESESMVDFELASFKDGKLNRVSDWKYFDLSKLGQVEHIYFTMSSTDSGSWGMNTPAYFCLDKLSVRPVTNGVQSVNSDTSDTITYNRTTGVITLSGACNAIVYDMSGNIILSHKGSEFNVSHLQHGVYIVRAGGVIKKIII